MNYLFVAVIYYLILMKIIGIITLNIYIIIYIS